MRNQTQEQLKSARKFQTSSRGTLNTFVAPSIFLGNFWVFFLFSENVTWRVNTAQICSSLVANDLKNKICLVVIYSCGGATKSLWGPAASMDPLSVSRMTDKLIWCICRMISITDGETEVLCEKLDLVPRYCRNLRASITANGRWSFILQYYHVTTILACVMIVRCRYLPR